MTPDFALLLSFEGISLLHRESGGWAVLGRVTLDDPDLDDHMAAMRDRALALSKEQFTTKIILPNDQIRYVETRLEPGKNRRETIEGALEGETPYAIEDLVYDSDKTHPIHIAAVARETLNEAEEFALTHQMNPVCFAAVPPERQFDGEPFFGTTKSAAKFATRPQDITADTRPVTVLSRDQNADDASVVAHAIPPARPVEIGTPDGSDMSNRSVAKDPIKDRPEDTITATPLIFQHTKPDAPAARSENAETLRDSPVPDGNKPVTARRRLTPVAAPETSDTTDAPAVTVTAFSSKRTRRLPTAVSTTDADQTTPSQADDADNLTIFGARKRTSDSARPKYIGLVLTSFLLVCLMAIAAWASLFSETGIAGYFRNTPQPELPVITSAPAPAPETQLASLTDPGVIDTEPLDAPTAEELAENEGNTTPVSAEDAQAHYATTGIWQRAPLAPLAPSGRAEGDFYVASIDRTVRPHDAVALPEATGYQSDLRPLALTSPPPAGTIFALDENGLVQATEDGALTPSGIRVYAGRPTRSPPVRTGTAPQALVTPNLDRLAGLRPLQRPGALVENAERAQFGGRSRSELSGLRPALRPASEQEIATTDSDTSDDTATPQAVVASFVPRGRPEGFEKTVALARASAPADDDTIVVASAAAVATPSIPTRASVARQATVENALNLRKINLIGVYGKSTDRRALIRLANGRYVKVQIGDRVDGGQVAAIGEAELSYTKRGKNIVLRMPKG